MWGLPLHRKRHPRRERTHMYIIPPGKVLVPCTIIRGYRLEPLQGSVVMVALFPRAMPWATEPCRPTACIHLATYIRMVTSAH